MEDRSGSDLLFDRIRQSRKPIGPSKDDGSLQIVDADAYPMLLTLLTTLPPGSKGVNPGRVAFFVQKGILTCCVTCQAMQAVAFLDAEGFQDAFCRVETKLRDGSLEWREDRPKARK